MKKTVKGFVLGVIITTILMSTVFGAQVKKTIDVIYNSVNITLNGEKVDTDNILFEGTTYLPLRVISEMLGKEVSWDQETKTASIYDKKAEIGKSEVESLVGYMVIEDNTLHFDKVEIVKLEDKERMKELGLTPRDLPNGYHIHNADIEKNTYELTDETVYSFVDFHLLFVEDENGDRAYTTTKKDKFLQRFGENNLNDIPLTEQRIPCFIEVQDGKVISITEEFIYTM